jgi:hypothetical protein
MARVYDDIVHFFKKRDVDIMALQPERLRELCAGEADRVYEHLDKRSSPTGDLIAAVIEAEQYIASIEEQLRALRSDNRILRVQLRAAERIMGGTPGVNKEDWE